MPCVPLDFDKNITIDALVDLQALSVHLLRTSWTQKKQKAPNIIFKIDDPPNCQIQVANGQLEKSLATATLKFDIGDSKFVERFVVMGN